MKTTKRSNQTLPSPFKFSIYLFAVAVFCFVNWTALRAEEPAENMTWTLEDRLTEALIEEADPEMQLEDWMVDYSEFCHAEDNETEPSLKEWMVNTSSWTTIDLLAKK